MRPVLRGVAFGVVALTAIAITIYQIVSITFALVYGLYLIVT